MAPRQNKPPRGVVIADVHLDVVAWHGDRRFIGDGAALGRLVAELRARRDGGDQGAVGVMTQRIIW